MYTEVERESKGSTEKTDKFKITRYKSSLKDDNGEIHKGHYVETESFLSGDVEHHWEIGTNVLFNFNVHPITVGKVSPMEVEKKDVIEIEKNVMLPTKSEEVNLTVEAENYEPGRLF